MFYIQFWVVADSLDSINDSCPFFLYEAEAENYASGTGGQVFASTVAEFDPETDFAPA